MTPKAFFVLLLSSSLLGGCVPLAIGAGAAAIGGVAAGQEGGVRSAVSDTAIKSKISNSWYDYDKDVFSKLNITVEQGQVLLTGIVQSPEQRMEAVRRAWQVKGVKQVNNEIQVGDERSYGTFAQDKWITSQLRSQMLFNANIQSVNYSIETIKGVVYLMGVAKDQAELDRVVRVARKTSYVKQVVSYVKLAGEPVRSQAGAVRATQPAAYSSTTTSTTYTPSSGMDDMNSATGAPMPLTPSRSEIQSEVLPP